MSHQVSLIDKVLTVRLDGRANAQEVYQDIRAALDCQTEPVIMIINLTFATNFDQYLKSMFYRASQHHHIKAIGICGINPEIAASVNDLLPILGRIRKVTVGETDPDLYAELGLVAPLPQHRKLSGMLAYLKKD